MATTPGPPPLIERGKYPAIEVSDNGHGDKNVLIRVDSLHISGPQAFTEYLEVTVNNVTEICHGLDFMVYQAGARGADWILWAEQGLHR
eukprot:4157184-Heterocapsa_arctica.AAC.1